MLPAGLNPLTQLHVSIRARSFERAMQPITVQSSQTSRFNPRPLFRAGDALIEQPFERSLAAFQSAPALSSGRCTGACRRRASRSSFNPRPLFRAGDAAP